MTSTMIHFQSLPTSPLGTRTVRLSPQDLQLCRLWLWRPLLDPRLPQALHPPQCKLPLWWPAPLTLLILQFVGIRSSLVDVPEFLLDGELSWFLYSSHPDDFYSRATVSPLVVGVAGACYCKFSSRALAEAAFEEAQQVGGVRTV